MFPRLGSKSKSKFWGRKNRECRSVLKACTERTNTVHLTSTWVNLVSNTVNSGYSLGCTTNSQVDQTQINTVNMRLSSKFHCQKVNNLKNLQSLWLWLRIWLVNLTISRIYSPVGTHYFSPCDHLPVNFSLIRTKSLWENEETIQNEWKKLKDLRWTASRINWTNY